MRACWKAGRRRSSSRSSFSSCSFPRPECSLRLLSLSVVEDGQGARETSQGSGPSFLLSESLPRPRLFHPWRKPETSSQRTRITIPKARRWWVPNLRKNSAIASIFFLSPVFPRRRSRKCPRGWEKTFRRGKLERTGQRSSAESWEAPSVEGSCH